MVWFLGELFSDMVFLLKFPQTVQIVEIFLGGGDLQVLLEVNRDVA